MDESKVQLDTNMVFSGGAGMFLEYHDIVKPVYLYAIFKMILEGESFGLPISILSNMTIFSLIEWYQNRRYINPFKCLDYNRYMGDDQLNAMMLGYLLHDESLYKLAPPLNILSMMDVYHSHHMSFPIYVYSRNEEPIIEEDCQRIFKGIHVEYVYGDLEKAIKRCDQNFTYIFSDIELLNDVVKLLVGTCSHVLLARDYRYNFIDGHQVFKYQLDDLAAQYPFVRIGTTLATNIVQIAASFRNLEEKFYGRL